MTDYLDLMDPILVELEDNVDLYDSYYTSAVECVD
jgi:hypothetical protein